MSFTNDPRDAVPGIHGDSSPQYQSKRYDNQVIILTLYSSSSSSIHHNHRHHHIHILIQ